MLAIETTPHDTGDAEYARLMAVEDAIINGGHTGRVAAEAALWIALTYDANTKSETDAIIAGDVGGLRGLRDKPNWQQQAIYAALLALREDRL